MDIQVEHFAYSLNHKKDTKQSKNKNNQNCEKIELYESLTAKDLKNKHSSRQVGGVERKQCSMARMQQEQPKEQLVPQSQAVDKNPEGQRESKQPQLQDRPCSRGFQCWEREPHNLSL